MFKMVRILYAPLFFVGFVGLAIHIADQGGGLLWLVVLLVCAILVSRFTEYFAPYERSWNNPHQDRIRDVIHAIVNEASIIALLVIMPVAASLVPWPSFWPSSQALWLQVGLAIILIDAGITLVHFASHRLNVLWRFHAVHHSVLRMYGFNGLLKHPVHQILEIMGGTLPWLFLGIPVEVAALGAFAVSIQLLLQHSNVDMKIGPLKYIWAVAPVHRHHHVASATEGDVNFGLFFTLWDVLLGTARFSSSCHVRAGTIGIDGEPDYPTTYLDQLTQPLKRRS